jgi:nicotinate-nucleotide--dimethylbenzimidazole phosphoribosyltransferase
MTDLSTVIPRIEPLNETTMNAARARQSQLTKPRGALGRLEEISVWLAGVYGEDKPVVRGKAVIVCAGDHGVTEEGVSPYPSAVTPAMVMNFLSGGAGINTIAQTVGSRVYVVDVGVASELSAHPDLIRAKVRAGTRNLMREAAMTRDEALRAIEAGVEATRGAMHHGANLIAAGDMGIGNTTPSSVLTAWFTGKNAREVVGRGTGAGDEMLEHKIRVVETALARVQPRDVLEALCEFGGLEIAAMTGVMLGAAAGRAAVIVDGFIAGAAAMVAVALEPRVRDYLHASHVSREPGHRAQLAWLQLEPLFDLGLALGEGTGAALAMPLLEAAARTLSEMATFESANVPDQDGGS